MQGEMEVVVNPVKLNSFEFAIINYFFGHHLKWKICLDKYLWFLVDKIKFVSKFCYDSLSNNILKHVGI